MISDARKTFRQIWWAPLVCFGVAWLLGRTSWGQIVEWRTLDWRTEFRTIYQKPPDPRLAVVLFEDQTEHLIQQTWPVDRSFHAQLTQVLALSGAKLVAWDVILDASREGDGDAAFGKIADAANQAGTRVLSAAVTNVDETGAEPGKEGPTRPITKVTGDISRLVGDEHAFIPFPELRATSHFGFADAPPGPDGLRREIPLVVRVGKEVYPGLALAALMAWFDVPAEKVEVNLGHEVVLPTADRLIRLPVTEDGRFLVNYRYDFDQRTTDLPVFNYGAVLLSLSAVHLEQKAVNVPPPDFKGKMVWIGQTVTGKADAGPTPLNSYAALVFMHVNLVANVLMDDFARKVPETLIWVVALVLGWLGLALVASRSVMVLCGAAVLGVVAYISLAVWTWVIASWWVPLAAPLAGFIALQFVVIGRRILEEQRGKQAIKGMFGAYLSPQVVDRLVKTGQMPQLGGHTEEITAYFSDIQGYSTFSEKLSAARLVELLNEYLTVCTDIIQEEGGTLDKYIGDAVVAMFGAPIPLPDHAYRACVASQRVQRALDELRQRWEAQGETWPLTVRQMRSRIGLNSGLAVVGNMGSRTRFSYTMTSDDVNLAARMESGAKSWGAYTMCSEATRTACIKHGGDRVVFRPLGRIVVKGRAQAVPIYEITGLKEHVTAQTLECIAIFSSGLERYYARDWEGALALFRRSAELEPNVPGKTPGVSSNPSLVFIGIVEHYRQEPPPPEWDGTYVMKEK